MITRQVASIRVDASPESVFATLADYNSYERWMPAVTYSRVLAEEGDILLAEFAWPIYTDTRFTIEAIHSPPESITFVQTDQLRKRGLSGRWQIAPGKDGQGSVLTGELALKTGFWEGLGARRKLRSALDEMLAAVARRAGVVRARPAARTKVLEVIRRATGLEVWLGGQVYHLRKGDGRGRAGK
jgi:ribosome-associated toxin RatA of RatAB toxin-antitoxin module